MVCLLQPECNFLHGFFRCKLPVEVVDVEVKVTSMQGTHIFKRDRTAQMIRCMPWTTKLHSHPIIVKKMRTFLEVENKMGPIISALVSQFRPPLQKLILTLEKVTPQKKRKRATPNKRFRPATLKATVTCPPLLQATPRPNNSASLAPATVREDTPWPGASKMLGNLFEERNGVHPTVYLAIEDKKGDVTVAKPPLKEESKMVEQTSGQKEEKCGWGPDCPFCKAQKKDGKDQQQKPLPKPQAKRPGTLSMTKTRQQWEEEMERLNTKYNLDCFSDCEPDSKSDENEWYQYEHGYETLIWRTLENQSNRKARNFHGNIIFEKYLTNTKY